MVAEELVLVYPEEQIRAQIEALAHRDAKDPAAVLVKAIREEWALPAAMLDRHAEEARRRAEAEKAAARREEADRREAERSQMLKRLEAYWQELSSDERAGVEREVRERVRLISPLIAGIMDAPRPLGPIARSTIEAARQEILRQRLGAE